MKTEAAQAVRQHLERLARDAIAAAAEVADAAARYAELVEATLERGGKLLYAGNGGSAASAEHMATEYVVRLRRERRALPAIALSSCTATLTACANDLGFEQIFARSLEAHGRPGDLLIMHSTSGNSANLLEAARTARSLQIQTVALLDRDGGPLAPLVDLAIRLPADGSAAVQELQLALEHAVADLVESSIAADEGGG
jgi:D-sedoheptulose 7-phosphate isomerase